MSAANRKRSCLFISFRFSQRRIALVYNKMCVCVCVCVFYFIYRYEWWWSISRSRQFFPAQYLKFRVVYSFRLRFWNPTRNAFVSVAGTLSTVSLAYSVCIDVYVIHYNVCNIIVIFYFSKCVVRFYLFIIQRLGKPSLL